MAGYSSTPLPKKLGIKSGSRVALIDSPEGFVDLLAPLPFAVTISEALAGPHDVIVAFVADRATLETEFSTLKQGLAFEGGLWIGWPKKASGVRTDLTEDVIREIGLAAGLVDNKICAINEIWSGLRFVYRLSDRPAKRVEPSGPRDGLSPTVREEYPPLSERD